MARETNNSRIRVLDANNDLDQIVFADWFNKNKPDDLKEIIEYDSRAIMFYAAAWHEPYDADVIMVNGRMGIRTKIDDMRTDIDFMTPKQFIDEAYKTLSDRTKEYDTGDKNYRSASEENRKNTHIRIMLQDKDLLEYDLGMIDENELLKRQRMGNLSFEKETNDFTKVIHFFDEQYDVAQSNIDNYERSIRGDYADPIESMEAFVNGTDDERAAMTKEFRERNFAKDKNLFAELKDTLSEGTVFIGKNKTLGDIQIRRGNKHTGLVHIIERRYAERVLNQKVLTDPEQAKKEITAISFLVADSLEKQEAIKQANGNWKIDDNGIEAIISKDAKGRFVLTGYDDNRQKKEATESINAVIAKYGNTPDFLGVYGQVGAVIASLQQNIPQEQNSVNEKYNKLHDKVYKTCTVGINGTKYEFKEGLLNEAVNMKLELNKWQSMTPKDLRNLANEIENKNEIER